MSLSVEDLLKPRYKAIQLYPFCPYEIGQLIKYSDDRNWFLSVFILYNAEGSRVEKSIYHRIETVDHYPHLFQKLEWWQERSHEELPDYVKRIHNGKLFVYKKEYWGNSEESKGIKYTTSDGISLLNYIGTCEIATLEEYNAYQSSIIDTTLTNKIK